MITVTLSRTDGAVLDIKEKKGGRTFEQSCDAFAQATADIWQEVADGKLQKQNHA